MSLKSLHESWSRPDNSRLTAKQLSFRLPIHIAAKLAAFCELYPQRNRTQIVADLLDQAMDLLEATLPMELGEQVFENDTNPPEQRMHHCAGVRAKFRERANLIYELFEEEQGIQQPIRLYEPLFVSPKIIKDGFGDQGTNR